MLTNYNLRTWAQIDLDALSNNFRVLSELLPGETLKMAIVKADAYGHGAQYIAKELADKIDYFGVARADEAVELRRCGIVNTKILILGHTAPYHYSVLFKHDLIPTVYDFTEACLLEKSAAEYGQRINIHIAIDTGMNRIGFDPTPESIEKIKTIASFEHLCVDGIFSHLADADNTSDLSFTYSQLEKFRSFTDKLSLEGVSIPVRHLYNSAAISELESEFEMVREGIYLYGLLPSASLKTEKTASLRPVMSLRSEVIHIHDIKKGTPVSYGCTFKAPGDMTIATVCAGYADGVPRALSDKGYVLINGKRAKIVGRICMDQLMCDVTGIDDVQIGSVVTIFGSDGEYEITADDVASCVGTIPYEVICGISKRVPRVYLKNGEVETIHYGIPHEEF